MDLKSSLRLLSILVFSLCLSAKTHAQIEVFGISIGMSPERAIIELHERGYTAYSFDEYGVPAPCVQNGRVVYLAGTLTRPWGDCLSLSWSSNSWEKACASQLISLRECYVKTGETPHDASCVDERKFVNKCRFMPRIESFVGVYYYDDFDYVIEFGCEIFETCSSSLEDTIRILIRKFGNQLKQSSSGIVKNGNFDDFGYCMFGTMHDRICIKDTRDIVLEAGLYVRPVDQFDLLRPSFE